MPRSETTVEGASGRHARSGLAVPILSGVMTLLTVAACSQAPPGGNRPPTAVVSASTTSGPAPLTVTFDGSASSDPDGAIVAYAWQFGDGASAIGPSATHTYVAPGAFTAQLTVTDDRGASRSATLAIQVTPADGNDGTDGDEGTAAATTASVHRAAEAAFELPGFLIAASVDAALEATRLNGAATVTGTLTETSPQTFEYASTPNDRLRVVLLDGRQWDLVFNGLPQGDFGDDGDRFLRNAHIIDVHVTSNAAAGSLDLAVVSQPGQANDTQVGSLVGSYVDTAGVAWSTDLAFERYYRAVAEITGNEVESIVAAEGSISAAALGVAGTVKRYFRYRLVNTAENFDHRVDHTFTHGATSYRLAGRVFVALLDSQPVDRDQWVIDGGLAADGEVIGGFVTSEDPTGLTVSLQVGGTSTALFSVSYF